MFSTTIIIKEQAAFIIKIFANVPCLIWTDQKFLRSTLANKDIWCFSRKYLNRAIEKPQEDRFAAILYHGEVKWEPK